jgi:hypothetical protein
MHRVLSKDVSEVEIYRDPRAFNQLLNTLGTIKDPTMRLKIVKSNGLLSLQAEKKPVRWYGRLFERLFGKSKIRQGKYVHAVIVELLDQNKLWLKKRPVSDFSEVQNTWLYIKAKFSYLKDFERTRIIASKEGSIERYVSRALMRLSSRQIKSAEVAGRQSARQKLAEEADPAAQDLSTLKRIQQTAEELLKTRAEIEQLEQEITISCQETLDLQEREREVREETARAFKEAASTEEAVRELESERHAHQLQSARFEKKIDESANLNRMGLQELEMIANQADVANKEAAAQFERFKTRNPESFDISLLARDGSVPSNSYFLSQIPCFKEWLKENRDAEISLSEYSLKVVEALNDYCLGKSKAQLLNIEELKELLHCATYLEYVELQETVKALLAI